MSTKLPDEIQVQELARGGVRYVFPRRRVPTLLRVIGSVLLLFGIFWTVVCLAMLVGGIAIMNGDREAWFFGVIFTLMTLVFAAIGCLPMWIGCLIAFGRDVVELRDGKVMHIARAGPFWHRKSRPLASLRRFVVSVSEGGLTVLNVEVEAADKLALATMYPREWLVLVAEELSQRSVELLGRSVDAGTAPVEVIEEATVKAERCRVWQDDPVAADTEWSPAKGYQMNFRTRQLVQRGVDRLEFPATLSNLLVSVFVLLMGVASTVLPGGLVIMNREWGALVFVLMGIVFLLLGANMVYSAISPIVFDRQRGLFWKGLTDSATRLDVIYALQIIIIADSEGSSPELNLVLENASRINVAHGGDIEQLRKDAERLAEFLNVPLWDAT
ncbi:MAG: hypothetical protein IH899_18715 [Planctomycetes bacterium]|nr:hypothetical protein [Planctomycetota bacterium]